MPPVFNHLVFAVASWVIGHGPCTRINSDPERIGFEGQALIGIGDGNRIVIRLEANPAR
jgi:hypothetical protein